MKYHDPWSLVVGETAKVLRADAATGIMSTDLGKIDVVAEYDISGNPTKPGQTANAIIVRPDREIGKNRGFYDTQSAIGYGPRTWAYHVFVKIELFPIRTTKDKDDLREMASNVSGRVQSALFAMQRSMPTERTEDGAWVFSMPATPFIQGAGFIVKDAGANRAIKAEQSLIVGFVLQYLGG